MTTRLTQAMAERFAASTLGHLGREYPHKLDHIMAGPEDVSSPAALHPIFHGSYDWHSCVHGWWQVMRLRRLFPAMAGADAITARANEMLVPDKAEPELAYLDRFAPRGFERPYGWAWLIALHGELALAPEQPWAAAMAPLAHCVAEAFRAYLPRLTYAVRNGAHGNTAFALILTHDWAATHDPALATLIEGCARLWYDDDRACQPWEPSGEDFLSPSLCEAVLMAATQPHDAFARWWRDYLPEPGAGRSAILLTPARVSDRSDGRIAHLDGLNLSRAWCWRRLAAHPALTAAQRALAEQAAEAHLAASLPHLADHYMGEHWLASFALLATEERR